MPSPHTFPTVLSSKRLHIAVPTSQDNPQVMAVAGDLEVSKHLRGVPHPYGPDDAQAWIQKAQDPVEPAIRRGIYRHTQLIGCIGLHPASDGALEVGYMLARAVWRQGYGSEAALSFVRTAQQQFPTRHIIAGHKRDNVASGRILQTCGFVFIPARLNRMSAPLRA